jgi:rRNA processing protein Krr1/Pno1
MIETEDSTPRSEGSSDINHFMMNRKDYELMRQIMANISCSFDKKTSVITITVKDQDPLICATMADSVKAHLQSFMHFKISKGSYN